MLGPPSTGGLVTLVCRKSRLTLMAKIQRGEGTIGKFMNDTTLYVDLRKTMQSMTDLLNEIKKNPGKIGVTVKIF